MLGFIVIFVGIIFIIFDLLSSMKVAKATNQISITSWLFSAFNNKRIVK